MARLTSVEFYFNEMWVCPAGVTKIILFMCGGGGGAGGGDDAGTNKAGGGAGSNTVFHCLSVVPGVSYQVWIGEGGAGGTNAIGVVGGNTTFDTDAAIAQGARRGGNFFSRGNGGTLNPRTRNWATGGGQSSLFGMPNGGYLGGVADGSAGGGGAGGRGNGGNGNASGTGESGAPGSGAGGGAGFPTGGDGGSGHCVIIWSA